MVLIAAGALLSAGPALADYPDDCLGMGVVSGAGCEHTEAYEGCCDDLGRVIWCENGDTYCIDCAGLNPSCGWQGDFYDCGTDGSPEPSGTFPLECVSCEPACVPGTKCVGGECVPCEPECEGKNCGSDNCGGDCGECSGGQTCSGGLCQVVGCEALPSAGCGGCPCEACVCEMDPFCCDNTWDGICAGECLEQCGGCLPLENCGDGDCDYDEGEGCANCPDDCACEGEDVCLANDCCTPDCEGKECGDDGCGGECPACPDGSVCVGTDCCTPDCDGKECGDDGCGGNCAVCELGACMNNVCVTDPGCVPGDGTGCGGCFCEDCVCEMDPYCCETAWDGICVGECVDQCGGCMEPCDPACEDGFKCEDMECIACGDNECGGGCGECGDGYVCLEGLCEEVPLCEAPFTIACGEALAGDTTNFENVIDLYECIGWDETGPELAYILSPVVDDVVTATLSDLGDNDLDILITEGECSAYTCIESGNTSTEFAVEAGKTYYIIVDGFGGDMGPFTLTLGCESLCGDGECDGETCDSCPEDCACPDGESCYLGECCLPSCEGVECGDDGCGGNCGECGEGVCSQGVCMTGPGCVTNDFPGCGGCPCEQCVCDMDPFCCQTAWDSLCVGECVNDCGGCGEQCDPPCDPGFLCQDGECIECVADCTGKSCGPDGCGGECGLCPEGTVCMDNQCLTAGCEPLPAPGCGGCACEACVCAMDPFCCESQWDSICAGECLEECGGCPPVELCDPPCDDGFDCIAGECIECIPDCAGLACGDDGCGGVCGMCPEGTGCVGGACLVAGCEPLEGPGCGGCPCEGCVCEQDPYCCETMWDDICVGLCLEGCGGCPEVEDVCGDGFCGGTEDCTSCLDDCPCDGECVDGECVECVASCDGVECGDDGCDGSCGECEDGLACVDGLCIECTPNCDGVECGDDGCGGDCGVCDEGLYCDFGICTAGSCDGYCGFEEATPFGCFCDDACFEYDDCCPDVCEMCPDLVNCDCVPDCTEAECGDDGCGGDCGACDEGLDCIGGACIGEVVDPCDPNPCLTPPADYCDADGITLISFAAEGTCTLDDAGAPLCDYAEQTLDCSAQGMTCDVDKCIEGVVIPEDLGGGGENDVVEDAGTGEEDTGTGGGSSGGSSDCSTTGTGNPNTLFLLLGFMLSLVAIRRFRFTV